MKLTKSKLNQLIKEELSHTLYEQEHEQVQDPARDDLIDELLALVARWDPCEEGNPCEYRAQLNDVLQNYLDQGHRRTQPWPGARSVPPEATAATPEVS